MTDTNPQTQPSPRPGWVKVLGIVAAVLIVVVVALAIFGGGDHGPGRHLPGGDDGAEQGHTPPAEHGG